ncbi:SLATT domain-containing protein [Photobacterium toruni]|uniref:SLATT domain-containing protein n=1 Tax=Photobacterium toruni TaxID=1935446 RepID=UPI00210FDFD9|nr:SLATT domain-containing protein [Photobacterium toruni]
MKWFFNILVVKPFSWLFSLQAEEENESAPEKILLNSMRITAKCRFNASVRLERESKYAFLTTTVLSLGLIFIPLYQNSELTIPYGEKVLTMLQIFLAVAVLVYSVVIGTSKYDLRSTALDKCGVGIKELIRKLRHDISESTNNGISIDLKRYHSDYHKISTETENHIRVDYLLAVLESRSDFDITGVKRLYLYIKAYTMYLFPYIIPTSMMIFEVLFILDILGVTNCFTSIFGIERINNTK